MSTKKNHNITYWNFPDKIYSIDLEEELDLCTCFCSIILLFTMHSCSMVYKRSDSRTMDIHLGKVFHFFFFYKD